MEGMNQSLYNAIGNRIQSRIARLNSGYIPVYDRHAEYENQLRYRYKAFGPSLPSGLCNSK